MQFVRTNGSPNCDSNRKTIDRIVIHWVGVGDAKAAVAHFGKVTAGTSAHYVVEEDLVYEVVPVNMVAYHSGNYAMNQRSIGIETSATPDRPASPKTLETLSKLIKQLSVDHNIPLSDSHIIPHKAVKPTQCPGTVPINQVIEMAKAIGGDMSEIEKLRKEADDARKERDRNWNLYQSQLDLTKTANERLSKSEEEVSRLNTKLVEVVKTSENKAESDLLVINTLKKQLEGTQPHGALGYISLAVQAIIERRWN